MSLKANTQGRANVTSKSAAANLPGLGGSHIEGDISICRGLEAAVTGGVGRLGRQVARGGVTEEEAAHPLLLRTAVPAARRPVADSSSYSQVMIGRLP
jgi:hypothetical protein